MNNIDLLINKLGKENVLLNEDMSKHISFKTGGTADVFVKVNSIKNMKFLLDFVKNNGSSLFILGNGSNVLVTDKGIRGIVCKIEINKFEIEKSEDDIFVTIGSGNKNGEIAQKLLKLEITGFEFASRNSWNTRWSNKNECWCIWQRNEGYSYIVNIYEL